MLGTEIKLMPKIHDGKSVIQISILKESDDDGDESDIDTMVPFQIAYAISIHKAQGLEYNSVRIVITKEVDKMITHNIFYTAITRAREHLKIYCTPESQNKILENFTMDTSSRDISIFSSRTGIKPIKQK